MVKIFFNKDKRIYNFGKIVSYDRKRGEWEMCLGFGLIFNGLFFKK